MLNKNTNNKIYATIIDGSLRVRSFEGVEGAIRRDYELSDGTKGFKFELSYKDLSGKIEKIEFKDGDYGKMLEITVDGTTLSVGVKTNYGTDLMKKLPELDLSQEVVLAPYAFVDDRGKARKGITVYQNGKKIPSYFHAMDGKKFKSIHDFPIPENAGVGFTKNQWIAFYLKVEDFLIAYTEKNIISKLKPAVDFEEHRERNFNLIGSTQDVVENAAEIMRGEKISDEELSQVPF